jgi:hypothetical protein
MGNLVGLPGVKGGVIKDVRIARTVSGALRLLRTHRAVTGSGDHGAWTVWKDDAGALRCEFSRWRSPINEATFTKKKDVKAWLLKWMRKCEERSP